MKYQEAGVWIAGHETDDPREGARNLGDLCVVPAHG